VQGCSRSGGKDPWFGRLPRLDHEQYVDYL
jgi:hypothetical protein